MDLYGGDSRVPGRERQRVPVLADRVCRILVEQRRDTELRAHAERNLE
jgi:hypothetical protein